MHNILVIGAGKIGSTIARLLDATGDYAVAVADSAAAQLDRLTCGSRIERLVLDVTDPAALRLALAGRFAVLSAAPYHLTAAHRRGGAVAPARIIST